MEPHPVEGDPEVCLLNLQDNILSMISRS